MRSPLPGRQGRIISLSERIPGTLIALVSRIAAASAFWTTGQAKLDRPVIDIFRLRFELEWPEISETSLELFTYLYRLDLPRIELLFIGSAIAEHLFAALLLIGLATRLSSLVLLLVTAGIEFWIYPEAYATYALWVATLLYLLARGPGAISLDHLIARWRFNRPNAANHR